MGAVLATGVLVACQLPDDSGYVEIKAAPAGTTIPQPSLYLDSVKLEPLRKGDQRAPESPGRRACEWRDLAATCRQSNPTVRAMLLVGWYSAARPGELRRKGRSHRRANGQCRGARRPVPGAA